MEADDLTKVFFIGTMLQSELFLFWRYKITQPLLRYKTKVANVGTTVYRQDKESRFPLFT